MLMQIDDDRSNPRKARGPVTAKAVFFVLALALLVWIVVLWFSQK